MLKYVRGEIQEEIHFAFYLFMHHLSRLSTSASVQLGKSNTQNSNEWLTIEAEARSYFACLGNWNNNSAWLRVLWEWRIKAQCLTHNWYSTNIKLFQKNIELMCTSTLKNGKEAYRNFVRTLSTRFLESNQTPPRAESCVCFQVSSACLHEPTSLPTVMGMVESTWLVHSKAQAMSECQCTMSEGRTNPGKCFKSSEHIHV